MNKVEEALNRKVRNLQNEAEELIADLTKALRVIRDMPAAIRAMDKAVVAEAIDATLEMLKEREATIVELREGVEQMAWVEWHGCATGDCPHDDVQDCATALGEALAEVSTEARALLKGRDDNDG